MFDTGTGAARRNFLEHTMHVSVFLRHGGALVVYAVVLVSAPRISVAGVVFAVSSLPILLLQLWRNLRPAATA